MKHHPAWLAAGLLLFAVLACNLSKNRNSSSNNSNSNAPARADVYVDQIQMAKDDHGAAGDSTTTFDPSERKVHFIVTLNKAKAGTRMRAVCVAADVEGVRNKELKSVDYVTNSDDTKIKGYFTSPGRWLRGQYRVEVYVNGALDKTQNFNIQ
jgi:hypothetical protein